MSKKRKHTKVQSIHASRDNKGVIGYWLTDGDNLSSTLRRATRGSLTSCPGKSISSQKCT